LSDTALLGDKLGALVRLSDFFGLEADWSTIASSDVFREHAKAPNTAFDAADRAAQLENSGAAHFDELASARAWAKMIAQRAGAPIELDNSLMRSS
jgi:hypothetical protein